MKRRDYLVATAIATVIGYFTASELRSDRSSTETRESASRTATSESEPHSAGGYGVGGYGESVIHD
jgi:hypothetical protein